LNLPQLAAIAFLFILLVVPLVAVTIALARSNMNPLQCVLWGLAYLLCRFLWRTKWPGWLPLAEGQGAIVVCNHRSSVDPFFVQTGTGRKVHWLVAREYCEHFAFRWFLKACEVVPVSRGGVDTAATKAAIRYVAAGGLVGMLPEGRINMTEELLLPSRPGAALIALKAKAVVLPCFIRGAPYRRYAWSPLLMPARVEVTFGPPVDLSDLYGREGEPGVLQVAMLRILRALADTAGRPDFQPQLAGRNWKPTQAELNAAMDAADERAGNA
jgi:1-acyl-sn-glycerol-3-phosphate acyltransferase